MTVSALDMEWPELVACVDRVAARGDRRARSVLKSMLEHEQRGRQDPDEETLLRLESQVYVDGDPHAPDRGPA